MQENLAFLQLAKKSNARPRKITEAIFKIQESFNKSSIGVQEKDIDNVLTQTWDFFFTLIKNSSMSIQNSIERCANIFVLRNYSFYPEKFEKLIITQIKYRKKYSVRSQEKLLSSKEEQKNSAENINLDGETPKSEKILYDSSYSRYGDLILQLFTLIAPKISSMRIDSFLESCKNNGLFSIFSMKGNTTINTNAPKYISKLSVLGIDFHIDLLSSFLSEKVEYSQIKSINAIIDNYPSLFRRVLSTENFSLISFILSIHNNNSNDLFNPSIVNRYFTNLNNFPRTNDFIRYLFESTTVSDIDNFLMILSCDKFVKVRIVDKKSDENEEIDENEENEIENEDVDDETDCNIDNKMANFFNVITKFNRSLPLNKVINRSSFYNFAGIPFKFLIPKENDSIIILTVKFQKIAQMATIKNCQKIFSVFNHFLNERTNPNLGRGDDDGEKPGDELKPYFFYDELTSACLQNLPICINIFSVLPEFPVFLKKVLLVKPRSWLHASDISRVLGSLNSVHFNIIGGLGPIITKLFQFSMSSNQQLSDNAIESTVRISNINNCEKILNTLYESWDGFNPINTYVNLKIVSKLVEKNSFYFCVLTTYLERVLEIVDLFKNDFALVSEILHFVATIKNKTNSSSFDANSFLSEKSNESLNTESFGYGKKLKLLQDISLSIIYVCIQFFTGNSSFRLSQSLTNSIDSFYNLLQDYINSSDYDQISFGFLFNAFDFLSAFPSSDFKNLSLLLCDDLINVFPKEVSNFAANYPQNTLPQSFYKAFDYFSNAKDIEVGAIWCKTYLKIIESNLESTLNKQLDDKVNPVYMKMADFAFSSPTKVSKNCLNVLSLYLLKCSQLKNKLRDHIEQLKNKEARQSVLTFLHKEDQTEFNFLFPEITIVKGKYQLPTDKENEKDDAYDESKSKSNESDDYSDDEDEVSDEFNQGEMNDVDSESFSDKSQQDEFKFEKVIYLDLLNNYFEKDNEITNKNYLILTQLKYSLIEFSNENLKLLINNYFKYCDYESLFTLIIYCFRFNHEFPLIEFKDQFLITPFKNLFFFLCKIGNRKNKHLKNNPKNPHSVISLTSSYFINNSICKEKEEERNYDVYEQFLYYYDKFLINKENKDAKYTILKDIKSIDRLSANTTESSISNKSSNSSNDSNGLFSSKNKFSIRYLYEENDFDLDLLSSITSSSNNYNIEPTSTRSSIIYKVSLIKRILELLSFPTSIQQVKANDKISKKSLMRILSCIPFINKRFLSDDINLLEDALNVVSKADKPIHMKYSFLLLAVSASRIKSQWKISSIKPKVKLRSDSEKGDNKSIITTREKSFSLKKATSDMVINEKELVINETFIKNFYSIVHDNYDLLPQQEVSLCTRTIVEKADCREDSKLYDLVKLIYNNQSEFISSSFLNSFISILNFSPKLENLDISGMSNKFFSLKGVPSFFIRGCVFTYNYMIKSKQIINIKNISDGKKEFLITNSTIKNWKNSSFDSTRNFFVDDAFYNCYDLILSDNQLNAVSLIKQYDFFMVDPKLAEFTVSSRVLPNVIKRLNGLQPVIKKFQSYLMTFISPKQAEVDKKDGFNIMPTSLLPIYLDCIIELYSIDPDDFNDVGSIITNDLLEWLKTCKDFDCFNFSELVYKWNLLIAQHAGIEIALNFSCTIYPNFIPRFFPLFTAIVKFLDTFKNEVEKDEAKKQTFQAFLTNASLISQEKSNSRSLAFSLLVNNVKIKEALDLAQFDNDCDESEIIAAFVNSQLDVEK